MARWRRSGKNWEGRPWTITPALSVLLDELEEHYPVGNSSLDGTVASSRHDEVNPSSDHRPHPFIGTGVVRAIDCWVASPTDGVTITEALRASRDPRIRYVIHNRRIFASYDRPHRKPWEWGPYDGASPHTNHIHISVQDDNNTQPWNLFTRPPSTEDHMFAKYLTEAQWRLLYRAGVAKSASEAELIDRFVTNRDKVTDSDWARVSASLFTDLAVTRSQGGDHDHKVSITLS